MGTILSLVISLFLILGSPGMVGAKTAPKDPKSAPKTAQSSPDLETATADLQENIRDLRQNITSWRKIQGDTKMTPVEKKQWRDKAKSYLQECESYNDLLVKVEANKLPKSEVSRRFLSNRQIFQQEVQYLRQTLQQP